MADNRIMSFVEIIFPFEDVSEVEKLESASSQGTICRFSRLPRYVVVSVHSRWTVVNFCDVDASQEHKMSFFYLNIYTGCFSFNWLSIFFRCRRNM